MLESEEIQKQIDELTVKKKDAEERELSVEKDLAHKRAEMRFGNIIKLLKEANFAVEVVGSWLGWDNKDEALDTLYFHPDKDYVFVSVSKFTCSYIEYRADETGYEIGMVVQGKHYTVGKHGNPLEMVDAGYRWTKRSETMQDVEFIIKSVIQGGRLVVKGVADLVEQAKFMLSANK